MLGGDEEHAPDVRLDRDLVRYDRDRDKIGVEHDAPVPLGMRIVPLGAEALLIEPARPPLAVLPHAIAEEEHERHSPVFGNNDILDESAVRNSILVPIELPAEVFPAELKLIPRQFRHIFLKFGEVRP